MMMKISHGNLCSMAGACAATVLFLAPLVAAAAPLEVVSPQNGAVVPTLSAGQKAYVQMPRKERVKYFADSQKRKEMVKLGYDPEKVAYALGNRLLIEQEDIPRTHSINVNGEMGQLCVPNAILHMYISTVTA